MCGIIGFNWEDSKKITELTKVLNHRGPDDSGTFVNGMSLGHTRLSIIDLSKKGHQPMKIGNYVLVYNGEIYNHKEIRAELTEYKFHSNCDSEVLIYAYDKWGDKCLERLNGMFSFCIYNSKTKKAFLARDRFGIKPLYYIHTKTSFAFSSEIKALLPLLKNKEVDKQGLKQFFNIRFTLGENTLVKGVKKFLPGHFAQYDLDTNDLKIEKWYSLSVSPTNDSYEESTKKTRDLLHKAVSRRMIGDVDVATLLSGGLDSSIIAALAKKYDPTLRTFSMGFDTTNELPFAKEVSDHLSTEHHELTINKDSALTYLDEMVYHMDEPIVDPGFLPIFVLSKDISKHNKVVLSGDGGDEVFCGYDRYKLFKYGRKLSLLMPHHFGSDIGKKLVSLRFKKESQAFFEIIRLFDNNELSKLGVEKISLEDIWPKSKLTPTRKCQEFDIQTLLPGDFFMKADKMSSAFGLEQRVPFMDHELVEYALSLPENYTLKGWNEKRILKEAYKDLIPNSIISRRKQGFNVPIDYWFSNTLAEKLHTLLQESKHNLYKKDFVFELLIKARNPGKNYKENFILAQKLWGILVFEMWYEKFMK